MKLYTGKGDKGETGILGNERVSKDHARIEAYGTLDELNSIIGIVRLYSHISLEPSLQSIQSLLFEIGTELASQHPKPKVNQNDVELLERWIDQATEKTPSLTSFILPGGSEAASWLHLARTACRRAERRIVTFQNENSINPSIIIYLNRLSDLFFAWARWENHESGIEDIEWKARV